MILDFGYICMEMHTDIAKPLKAGKQHQSTYCDISIGGSGALQAIAAARAGARVNLCGTIGNDLYGKTILETLRREGIHSTAIAKSDDIQTSLIQSVLDSKGQKTLITNTGANTKSNASQVANIWLSEKTLLLLQNDCSTEVNLQILKRAKAKGAMTMMCFSHTDNIDKLLFKHLDFCITEDEKELPATAPTSIIFSNNQTISAQINGEETTLPQTTEINDTTGAFDCFCGTFAACIQAGTSTKKSINYALNAAALCAQKKGGYTALPFLDDIEKNMCKNT